MSDFWEKSNIEWLARLLYEKNTNWDHIGFTASEADKREINRNEKGYEWEKEYLTEDSRRLFIELAERATKEAKQIIKELKLENNLGGPEQCREEVTGLGTRATNKNLGNSGFSGGSMMRLAAA